MLFTELFSPLSSLPAGYQHEEGLQEQYHPGPAGGVEDLRPQPRGGDVPPLWQTSSAQHPQPLQVGRLAQLFYTGGSDSVQYSWKVWIPFEIWIPFCESRIWTDKLNNLKKLTRKVLRLAALNHSLFSGS